MITGLLINFFDTKDLEFVTDIDHWGPSELQFSYGAGMGNGTFNGVIEALQRNEYDIGIQVICLINVVPFWDSGPKSGRRER